MSTGHILIVDDEEETINSLAELLANQTDFVVSAATDGQEAKECLEAALSSPEGPVDLVVLDWRMPDLSGLDVLAWLRNHPTLAYTRVIMCTASSQNEDKVEALSAGADDYVVKPYHNQEMLARIETILRSQRLEKQLQEQSEQLAALNQVSNAITTSLDLGQIHVATVNGARQVVRAQITALFLREISRETRGNGDHSSSASRREILHCRAVASASPELQPSDFGSVTAGQGAIGWAYEAQQTLCVNDPQSVERADMRLDAPENVALHNYMVTPMIVRGHSVGILLAANRIGEPFGDVDQELLASLASAVSRALENASLFLSVRTRQQELQESHNRLQAVINGILNPIYTIDEGYRLMAVNKHKADELRTTPESLVGRICYRAFFNRRSPCDHCRAAEMHADRQPQNWSVRWVGD
ncbi:MAG TPA: response regulator, partial [Candidatus Binatia bacterium]|nr:response regulator [Candidatus Binatia bacterium]